MSKVVSFLDCAFGAPLGMTAGYSGRRAARV